MEKISWCKKQRRGIELIAPNKNLSNEYYFSAEESLRVLRKIKSTNSETWIATTKYYARYFGFYSVLMKIGIKCEIHDCTIALALFLEKRGIIRDISKKLEEDKELRIENQYYLKNKKVKVDLGELADYLLNIKKVNDSLTEDKIKDIREKILKS